MKKSNIEVEGGELLLMSDEGHYAVIPAKNRLEVIDMVKEGCDNCINAFIQTLPQESDYAEDGTVLSSFQKAFRDARKDKLNNFEFEGKIYTTQTAEEAIAKNEPQWVYPDKPNYKGKDKEVQKQPVVTKPITTATTTATNNYTVTPPASTTAPSTNTPTIAADDKPKPEDFVWNDVETVIGSNNKEELKTEKGKKEPPKKVEVTKPTSATTEPAKNTKPVIPPPIKAVFDDVPKKKEDTKEQSAFDEWYKTVPKEKADTTNYNLRRAFELALKEQLDAFVNNPDAHLYSAYENKETGEYEFVKSKNHKTIKEELDWYNGNSEQAIDFRNKYDLDKSGEYYKYVPKKIIEKETEDILPNNADKFIQGVTKQPNKSTMPEAKPINTFKQGVIKPPEKLRAVKDYSKLDIKSETFEKFKQFEGFGYSMQDRGGKNTSDCSSIVCRLFGIDYKGVTSEDIFRGPTTTDKKANTPLDELEDGMLIFFDTGGTSFDKHRKFGIDHVGIIIKDKETNKLYIGENADGEYLKGTGLSELTERMEQLKDSGTLKNYWTAKMKKK